MPRTAEQNQNIKDKRRAKLISFALKAFATYGYDHTAIDDITKLAKCSHGLFYHYFDSKEAVFGALVDEVLTKEGELPIAEALEKGGVAGLRVLARHAEKVAEGTGKDLAAAKIVIFLDEARNLEETGIAFARSHNLNGALATLIREGQQEGKVIAGEPKEIAQAIVDMVKGALARLSNKEASGIHVSGDVLMGLLLKGPIEE